jgi:hypothetical protein
MPTEARRGLSAWVLAIEEMDIDKIKAAMKSMGLEFKDGMEPQGASEQATPPGLPSLHPAKLRARLYTTCVPAMWIIRSKHAVALLGADLQMKGMASDSA